MRMAEKADKMGENIALLQMILDKKDIFRVLSLMNHRELHSLSVSEWFPNEIEFRIQ